MALTTHPSPAIKQGWLRAIVFFVVYLGTYFLVSALAGVVWALQQPPAADTAALLHNRSFNILLLLVNALVSIGMAFIFRRFIDRQSIGSMGFGWKGRQRTAWAGFLLGIILLGVGSLLLYFTQHIDWLDTRLDMGAIGTGLGLFLLTALSEEIVFRGYVLNNLLSSMDKWTALIVVSILFALVHLGNAGLNPVAVLNLVAGGVLLGINYIFTRNLWFSIFFHFSWNFFQGVVLGYEVSGLELQSIWHMDRKGDELLTGGAFGFEGSAVATGLLVMAIFLCLQRKWWDGIEGNKAARQQGDEVDSRYFGKKRSR
jgi:membrane protease YdiL (CAAX protease family)